MSGVIGPLSLSTQKSELRHSALLVPRRVGCHRTALGGSRDEGQRGDCGWRVRTFVASFRRRLHYCTNAGITWKKSHLVPPFGTSGVLSRRDGSLHKPFDR